MSLNNIDWDALGAHAEVWSGEFLGGHFRLVFCNTELWLVCDPAGEGSDHGYAMQLNDPALISLVDTLDSFDEWRYAE